jgi:cobalt/nickel transport system permease protein
MIGIFNPIFDRGAIIYISDIGISGGWISFTAILIKFILTVSTAFTLIVCTGFNNICFALNQLYVPKIFSTQLLFLYRYIFVLAEEGARMIRARNLRSFNGKGKGIKSYGPLLGNFFLRTINRAERLHLAMLCRGFDGNIKVMNRFRFGLREFLFMLIWVSLFILFRLVNVTQFIGIYFARLFI